MRRRQGAEVEPGPPAEGAQHGRGGVRRGLEPGVQQVVGQVDGRAQLAGVPPRHPAPLSPHASLLKNRGRGRLGGRRRGDEQRLQELEAMGPLRCPSAGLWSFCLRPAKVGLGKGEPQFLQPLPYQLLMFSQNSLN